MTWQFTHALGSLLRYEAPSAYRAVKAPVPSAAPTRTHKTSANTLSAQRAARRFRACAALVLLEVVDEQPGELAGRGVEGGPVAPGVARPHDFGRHAGSRGDHVEAEHGVALGLCPGQGAAVNRVENGTRVGEFDP